MHSMVIYKVSTIRLLVCVSDESRGESWSHGAYNSVKEDDSKDVNKHSVFNL